MIYVHYYREIIIMFALELKMLKEWNERKNLFYLLQSMKSEN